MENNQTSNRTVKILIVCGVLLISAVIAFWMLSERTLDSHECFVSLTAREMLQSGDWLIPTCNGQPRLNKTPLSYWLVAGLGKIGGNIDEVTARLPSAVFAILSAAAVLYFVSRWLSFRIAVMSTIVWVTSLGYLRNSHSARPDMVLAFFIVLCLMSFYSAVTAENRRRQIIYMLIFWISFGLGNLAKGPAPIPLVLIPLGAYIVINRSWRLIPKLLPFTGVIIFLAIMLPWPLFIANSWHWDLTLWKKEYVQRLYGEYAPGRYPIYFYFLIMFKFVTPWVAFLPMALVAPFYRIWDKKLPVMKFLWLWFVADFIFLTIDAGKRQHYILPLMPAMTILIGILLEDMIFERKAYSKIFAKNVLQWHIVALIVGITAATIYLAKANPKTLPAMLILLSIAIVISAVVSVLFARGKNAAACGVGFAGIVAWTMIAYASFTVLLDINKGARDFALKIAAIVPQGDKLAAYKHASTRFVQYFGKVVPEIEDKSALYNYYEQGDWIVSTSEYLEELVSDSRFRQVYYRERDRGTKKEDTGGALFHKSAAGVKNDAAGN
jgi:4-amino-4-deoxy-L-arabinose transferase-like glycosyltransferase